MTRFTHTNVWPFLYYSVRFTIVEVLKVSMNFFVFFFLRRSGARPAKQDIEEKNILMDSVKGEKKEEEKKKKRDLLSNLFSSKSNKHMVNNNASNTHMRSDTHDQRNTLFASRIFFSFSLIALFMHYY